MCAGWSWLRGGQEGLASVRFSVATVTLYNGGRIRDATQRVRELGARSVYSRTFSNDNKWNGIKFIE